MFVLGQLITSLSPEAKTIVLNRQNRKHTSKTVETVNTLADFFVENCKDIELCEIFSQVIQKCHAIPESYYTAPEVPADIRPDQQFIDENEPQPDTRN